MTDSLTALIAARDALETEIKAFTATHHQFPLYTSLCEAIKRKKVSAAARKGAEATNAQKKLAKVRNNIKPPKTCIDLPDMDKKCPDCESLSFTGARCKYCVAKMAVAARQESRGVNQSSYAEEATDRIEKIRYLAFKGWTDAKIGIEIGHSAGYVCQIRKANNILPGSQQGKSLFPKNPASNDEGKRGIPETGITVFDNSEQLETRNPASSDNAENNLQVTQSVHKIESEVAKVTTVMMPETPSKPETIGQRVCRLKKEGHTLGRVQQIINAQSQSERAEISLIYMGKSAL